MSLALIQAGYNYNEQTSVWIRHDHSGIAYSDGDEVEQRIASIINNATDLDVLSDELRRYCTDWPSLYHLSGTRANILRPFESDLCGDVLEIGAGCGAITRYLGECGGSVMALEGSPRRASIARARARDLDNVTVVSDRFDVFRCDKKFDVITLIGVLEYANMFTTGDNPTFSMLERARSFLKPNGKLIIAIENQLGLKYFAGAPEDHLGIPMYGIEGRYRNDQPQTFGRKELSGLLNRAGFISTKFLAPFPDYKLPASIVTERGFSCDAFDAAALAWQSVRRDPQLPPVLAFSPELVWLTIANNDLALDLANSFLIVASLGESEHSIHKNTLAWHFTTDRRKVFCKIAEFIQLEKEKIEVRYRRLNQNAVNPVLEGHLRHYLPERSEYRYGRVFSHDLMREVTKDGWSTHEVCALLRDWLSYLAARVEEQGEAIDFSSPFSRLAGGFFDCIPQNIIVSNDGDFHEIDVEWVTNERIELGYIVFRALFGFLNTISKFGRPAEDAGTTYYDFILSIFNGLGWSVLEDDIDRYVALESRIQAEVSGRLIDPLEVKRRLKRTSLPMNNLMQAMMENERAKLDIRNSLADAHCELSSRKAEIDELTQQADGLRALLKERKRAFDEIMASRSWRITRPMRWLARLLRGDMVGALDPLRRRGLIPAAGSAHVADAGYRFAESPRNPVAPTHPVAVIVPVYRGVEMTRRCIESAMPGVLAIPDARLLAINDGSTDDGMGGMLELLSARWPGRFEVLHNEHNLGFVQTVNRGIEALAGQDVVLLNSDVVVPIDWLARLRSEAYSRPDVGTVTPFSNNATICSFPFFLQENGSPYGLEVEQVDGVFRNALLPCVEAPTGVGFCMYVRRACLDAVGLLDAGRFGRGYGEENDLCQRALKAGWVNLITPNLYAFHEGGVSFSNEKQVLVECALRVLGELHPNYHADVALFCRADPVRRVRIIRHLQLIATLSRPKVLHVSHNLGGGVRQHLDELVAHLGDAVSSLLLTPSVEGGVDLRVGLHAAADMLHFGEEDFPALLAVLRAAGVSCVHFHHTMGLPEQVLDLPKALEATWLITVHDYYWLNGNPTLTGEDGRYPGYSDQIDHTGYRLPDGLSPAQWRDRLRPWLEGAACVIFPSAATKALFDDHFNIERTVIAAHLEPGRNVRAAQRPWRYVRPLVIGVLGALGREKGADYLEALASVARRLERPYDFRLLGYAYRPLRGVMATGAYRPDELLGMIEREGCGLILFPALWPETYSYTLSYALASGLPIIAPDLGAFPERLSGRASSLLYEAGRSPEALLETLDGFVAGLNAGHSESAPIWGGAVARTNFYDDAYMSLLATCQRSVPPAQAMPPVGIPEHVWQPVQVPGGWREQLASLLWHAYMHPSLHRVGRLVPARLRRAARTALSRRPMHDIVAPPMDAIEKRVTIRPQEVESARLELQPEPQSECNAVEFRSFYETRPPSIQTAVDLFKGDWKSAFPPEVGVMAGQAPMFEDTRPAWVNRNLPGGIAGKSILELGPFEGYQTYLLEKLGAASIESVEGNSVNFMKCLILKNVFGLKVRYVFGDFIAHLERVQGPFDMSWASGVLYHQVEPLRLLQLLAKKSSAIYLWTHYYDAQRIEQLAAPDRALFIDAGHVMKGLDGFQCMHYQRSYDIPQYQFNIPANWEGGNQAFAYWLEVEDIFAFLKSQGFHNINIDKFSDVHGLPCVSFLARR